MEAEKHQDVMISERNQEWARHPITYSYILA